ncbi:RES family NAD+ phosphorylase [Aeromonas hydrophila]
MSKCCINCFNDSALIEKIQRMGKISRCSFCSSKDVLCVEPSILSDVSDGIEFCIDEDIHGKALHEILSHDLNILSSTVSKPAELVKELALGVDDSKKWKVKYSPQKNSLLWLEFKKELIHKNRFFPTGNIYGKMFSSFQNEINSIEKNTFIQLIDELCEVREQTDYFYRARISDSALLKKHMGSPPPEKASAGRANPAGIVYLYVAENEDTCIREVRPSIGSTVYISTCVAKRSLKLINLTNPKKRISLLKYAGDEMELIINHLALIELFSKELAQPVIPERATLDYIPTQFLCEFIKSISDYDGITFTSSFGTGENIVLFYPDTVEINNPITKNVTSVSVCAE